MSLPGLQANTGSVCRLSHCDIRVESLTDQGLLGHVISDEQSRLLGKQVLYD